MMKKYDLIVIGMGPAGMSVTAMGVALGLDVLAIEPRKVGGECLNVGCIPSKALLKASEINFSTGKLALFGISSECNIKTDTTKTLELVRQKLGKMTGDKMLAQFEGATLLLNKGDASFIDKNTVLVGDTQYQGKKIFIATGTEPFIPPIPGIETLSDEQQLTNLNIFDLQVFPKKMIIIGGGAIGTEMAQAFARLGTSITLIQKDAYLMPNGDKDAGELLAIQFEKEGISVYNNTSISRIESVGDEVVVTTDQGDFKCDKILIATGRKPLIAPLNLDNAQIEVGKKGIITDSTLRTNQKNIYAIGDCNGRALLSHAAMHQGMLALMNAVNPTPFKLKVEKYMVPWTVFTKPEIAQVGLTEEQARQKYSNLIVLRKEFASYGRTITDGAPEGFIKVMTNKKGTIFGVTIIGESASEIIHEWILAMQKGHTMKDILMLQHSFPTVSMINKMIAEDWMMKVFKEKTFIKKLIKFFV